MTFNSGSAPVSGGYGAGSEDRHIFLPEGRGERKVSFDVRKHVSPSKHNISWRGTLTIVDEDHTVGQILRHALSSDPRVMTAGYVIPHPLENAMRLHVQTVESCPPLAAIADALDGSILSLHHLALNLDQQLQINKRPRK
jgi:DNA-directed RNA polymerase II subunit RPB11